MKKAVKAIVNDTPVVFDKSHFALNIDEQNATSSRSNRTSSYDSHHDKAGQVAQR